jgi:hypothetical protein
MGPKPVQLVPQGSKPVRVQVQLTAAVQVQELVQELTSVPVQMPPDAQQGN